MNGSEEHHTHARTGTNRLTRGSDMLHAHAAGDAQQVPEGEGRSEV